MVYPYHCRCGHEFEVVKPLSLIDKPELCPACGETAQRGIAAGAGFKMEVESSPRYNAWFHSDATQAKIKSGELEIPGKSADVRHL